MKRSLGERIISKLAKENKLAKQKRRMLSNGRAVRQIARQHEREPIAMTVGLILASGMTQVEMSQVLGVNQTTVSRYLLRRYAPTPLVMDRLIALARERNVELPEGLPN